MTAQHVWTQCDALLDAGRAILTNGSKTLTSGARPCLCGLSRVEGQNEGKGSYLVEEATCKPRDGGEMEGDTGQREEQGGARAVL